MEDIKYDLDAITEYFEEDLEEGDSFENYRKNIITIVAYLIGVSDEKFTGDDRFDIDEYKKLQTDENALLIRKLCILRTQFLRNYKSIQ